MKENSEVILIYLYLKTILTEVGVMNRDRMKLISLLAFFILTMSLMLKLYNKESEYRTKEAEYTRLLNESTKRILEADIEKKELKEEFLDNEKSLLEEIRDQEKIIEKQVKELEELKEFKDIMNTVKKFSRGNMGEREAVVTALSLLKAQNDTKMDWKVIAALIMTESSYRPQIVSDDPSYGLMQLMLPTANHMAKKIGKSKVTASELLSIEKNIELGSRYLLGQAVEFSSLSEGVMAYNFGAGRLRELKREKKVTFESRYLKKIKKYHRKIDDFLLGQKITMN